MFKPFFAMFAVGLLGVSLSAATVEMIDDARVEGQLVSIANGQLTLKLTTTRPATTQEAIPFSDIARVVLRTSTAAGASDGPGAAAADDSAESEPRSALASMISSMFGGNSSGPISTGPPPADTPSPSENAAAAPATRPLKTIDWTVKLIGGEQLHGRVAQWSSGKLRLDLAAPMSQPLELPLDQINQLWCSDATNVKKVQLLKIDRDAQDIAFVLKDAQVISVKGQVLGADADSLLFRYGDQDRKIALGRVVGIEMGQGRATASSSPIQLVHIEGGDSLSGVCSAIDDKAITLQTVWGAAARIPRGSILSIDFLNGRLIYLSRLKPTRVEQTPFFGRVIPYRVDRGFDGGPLRLSDGQYARGIAMHTRCVLDYDIGANFARFRVKVGFEEPAGAIGQAVLRVRCDDKVLYENSDARGANKPVDIDVDVSGIHKLTLEADFGKAQDAGGRIIWANARLLRGEAGQ